MVKCTLSYLLGDKKGDYDDLYDFDRDQVMPYFEPVKRLITLIESML